MTIKLSRHFTLDELIASDTAADQGIDNSPSWDDVVQLRELCQHTLEKVRMLCGRHPVLISSGYRCPQLNQAVGGASNSAHLYGCAADFTIPAFGSVDDICQLLQKHLVGLEIDQLINETGGGARWVHVGRAIPPSTEPRYECLNITNGQTTGA